MNPKLQEIIRQVGTDVSGKWIGTAQVPALVDAVLADLLANGYIDRDNYEEYRGHLKEQ